MKRLLTCMAAVGGIELAAVTARAAEKPTALDDSNMRVTAPGLLLVT